MPPVHRNTNSGTNTRSIRSGGVGIPCLGSGNLWHWSATGGVLQRNSFPVAILVARDTQSMDVEIRAVNPIDHQPGCRARGGPKSAGRYVPPAQTTVQYWQRNDGTGSRVKLCVCDGGRVLVAFAIQQS